MMETKTDKNLSQKTVFSFLHTMGLDAALVAKWAISSLQKPHILTHQTIYTKFYTINLIKNTLKISNEHIFLVDRGKLTNFAFPRVLHNVLNGMAD
jgi:hypothetical protein